MLNIITTKIIKKKKNQIVDPLTLLTPEFFSSILLLSARGPPYLTACPC
jgi:hypothetical protein